MKFLDLTQTINTKTPVYPGDPKVEIEVAATLDEGGYVDHKLTIGTHVGTHIDAPMHMIEGGKRLKDYDLERLIVPATCFDFNDFSANDLAGIKPGQAVLFYSGASERYLNDSYWQDYPVLNVEAAKALIKARVGIVGVDTGSVDNIDFFPVHKVLLSADILILENLTNLKSLVGKHFQLYVMPLKLEDDAAPARIVAALN